MIENPSLEKKEMRFIVEAVEIFSPGGKEKEKEERRKKKEKSD